MILLNTDRSQRRSPCIAGDRIAQLLFLRLTDVALVAADDLDDTHRGERGSRLQRALTASARKPLH